MEQGARRQAAVSTAERERARTSETTKRWVERLTRFGYVTRGVIFATVGALAARVAAGLGGELQGTRGALRAIYEQPFGRVLLGVTTVGLGGYVVWRFVQMALDPVLENGTWAGVMRRVGYFFSGAFYLLLMLTAAELAFHIGLLPENPRASGLMHVMRWPYGVWILGGIGVIILAVGLQTIYRGLGSTFMALYPVERFTRWKRRAALWIGLLGLTALGVTLCLIGAFLIQGATQLQPEADAGLVTAFRSLLMAPFGTWLLGAAAAGFVLYGLHCGMLGLYRRVWE